MLGLRIDHTEIDEVAEQAAFDHNVALGWHLHPHSIAFNVQIFESVVIQHVEVIRIDADLRGMSIPDDAYVSECEVLAVIEANRIAFDAPQRQVFKSRIKEISVRLRYLPAEKGSMHVVNLDALDRGVPLIPVERRKRNPPYINELAARQEITVGQRRRRHPHGSQTDFCQALRPIDVGVPRRTRNHIAFDARATAMQPKAITLERKILPILTDVDHFFRRIAAQGIGGVDRPQRYVSDERTNLIASFCLEGPAKHVVGHVVDEVHIA